jgi:hypothetical protein
MTMTKRIWVLGLVGLLGACAAEPEPAELGTTRSALAPEPDNAPDACLIFVASHPVGTVEITRYLTRLDGTPRPGLLVAVCAAGDTVCSAPLTTGITDDHGRVTLEVSAGFDGYYQITGADIRPTLLYLAPYVTSNVATINLSSMGAVARALRLTGSWVQSPDCNAVPREVPTRFGYDTVVPPLAAR